jgi:hypothetical protein
MSCKRKSCATISPKISFTEAKAITRKTTHNLENTGMVQYFYHSPSSPMPIRDVLNEQKKGHKREPHIEIGAENYWFKCYQNNIKNFANSKRRYLFLVTTCRDRSLRQNYRKQYTVGYIEKKEIIDRGGFLCIKGPISLFTFDDSIDNLSFFGRNFDRIRLLNSPYISETNTSSILRHFTSRKNILCDCIEEIKRIDCKNITCSREICAFPEQCLRWSTQ